MDTFRTNRWAVDELLERTDDIPSRAALARESEVRPSHITDILTGRRDASADLLHRIADALDVDVRAISADPFGIVEPLWRLYESAQRLAPHLNGGDFGLRDALAAVDEVLAAEDEGRR